MGRRPKALPPALQGRAFRVAGSGLPEQRTYAADLWMPTRGTRLPADRRDVESRCRAHAITLPAVAAFSHTTAAMLWRMPLPRLDGETLHITVPRGTRAPRRLESVGHQVEIASSEVAVVRGIRLTSPVRTFVDLAAMLDERDLVAVADAIASRRNPLATEPELRSALAHAAGRRGIREARAALQRMNGGSESPKETELRLLLLDAGLGPLTTNPSVHDAAGRFIARVDLAIPHLKIAIEYEGDHHRDRDQWRRDIARRRRLEAEGWIYISVTQADLTHPGQLLQDISAAIRSRR